MSNAAQVWRERGYMSMAGVNEEYQKMLELTDREGKSLKVRLRPYREGDAEDMINCIRDEYEDSYFKRGFYDPSYIHRKAEEGEITFLVAETRETTIAGMLILKQFYPEEEMCEIASLIFRKRYRGYGLAMPFFEYGMDILLSRAYSAAFCLPVLFHDVTQRLLYRLGLRAAGDLYLPPEHRSFCRKVYDRLGADYRLTEHDGEALGDKTDTMPVWIWSSVSGSCTPDILSGGGRLRESFSTAVNLRQCRPIRF